MAEDRSTWPGVGWGGSLWDKNNTFTETLLVDTGYIKCEKHVLGHE